jgi:O-antigen/teichoic acid export membrane protein
MGSSLRARVFRAGSWSLFGHFLTLVLRLGGTLILTRLFTPQLFGILAVSAAVQVAVGLLTDIGLRPAIIQSRNGHDRAFLDTAWTLQIVRGGLIWGVGLIVALCLYMIGRFGLLDGGSLYSDPLLPPIVAATSFTAVILGFQSTKSITAGRDLALGRLIAIELLNSAFNLVAIVLMGWITGSIWSFVIGAWLSGILSVCLSHFWLPGRNNSFAWRPEALKEIGRFGRWVFFSSSISSLAISGDRFLLAGWLSAADVGCYSIASNIASFPDTIAYRMFNNVAMPALSDIVRNQPDRLATLYNRIRFVSDSLLVFLAGAIFASGDWLIGLLYDSRYAAAGPMLQYLSFSLLFARYGVAQSLFISLGKPNYVTVLSIIKVISLFCLTPLLFHLFSIQGAILGISLHMAPTLLAVFWFSRRLGVSNFLFEIAVLLMWPFGWASGLLAVRAAAALGL